MTDELLDLGTAKQAVSTLTDYPAKIHVAATSAANVPMGPWSFSVSCSYSCGKDFRASGRVDFSGPRGMLQAVLVETENYAKTFNAEWEFVNLWMAQTLPQMAADFHTAEAAVAQAVRELQQNGQVSPATRAAVDNSLAALLTVLDASKQELTKGNSALSAWEQQLSKYEAEIGTARGNLEAAASQALAAVKNDIAKYPCGQDDAMRQYNTFKGQLSSATASFQQIFTTLGGQSTAAHRAVSVLLGTVVNFISKYTPVIAGVQKAQGAQLGTVLQKFDLTIAANQWQGLADYAKQQLGAGQAALVNELVRAGVDRSVAVQHAERVFAQAA